MSTPIVTLEIRGERDVVAARQRARRIAELLGFGEQDRTRIATAVSEIARNTFRYAGTGRVEYAVADAPRGQSLRIGFSDRGPGIEKVDEVLDGAYRSATGLGLGIVGARRLMDHFELDSAPGQGTRVVLWKRLPGEAGPRTPAEVAALVDRLAAEGPGSVYEELQEQNRELLRALDEGRVREDTLKRLNRELEDTNRGVVALYAELDERVEQLRRSNTLRAQFSSYLSHEFRTPLDSMLAISGLLLDRVDGELTEEQARQVGYIRHSARDLLNMVDDLLDTARVEAGQLAVHPGTFVVSDLFNALRATLRPLLVSEAVTLVIEDVAGLPPMETDEAKVTQILRNLIANSLKFTERGEIRVRAEALPGGRVRFSVADTGVGIAPENASWIFEDFSRVEGDVQRTAKGTGLGLPLSRKLARLLGGDVAVRSTPGAGSVFTLEIPRTYTAAEDSDGVASGEEGPG